MNTGSLNTGRLHNRVIAIAISPAALRDDCRAADVLILRFAMALPCGRTSKEGQILITPSHLARAGAHAVFVEGGALRLQTVAEARGHRPWSGPLGDRLSPDERGPMNVGPMNVGRVAGFTSLFERFRDPRPEIDDDAWPRGLPRGEVP